MIWQNLHTHTTFCDGLNTPEDMVQAALALGMDSLGFSGHSPLPWHGESWQWATRDMPAYHAEIRRLQEKYKGRLTIFLGVEQDADSVPMPFPYEYSIHSVHQVWADGIPFSVDNTAEETARIIRDCFGSDPYAYMEAYFRRVADIADRLDDTSLVGHFDLPVKFNESGEPGAYIDETHFRYRAAALEALDALAKRDTLFEINTGAMAKGYRMVPYPSAALLKAIRAQGGRICIASDAHHKDALLYGFRTAAELALACGFREMWVLTGDGFVSQGLEKFLS